MPLIELSRFYPAGADEVFDALMVTVYDRAKFRSADNFSRSVTFSTRMTAFASGSNMQASVQPDRGGCVVRVEGQAKMRTQVNANNAAHKQAVAILDETGRLLREALEAQDDERLDG